MIKPVSFMILSLLATGFSSPSFAKNQHESMSSKHTQNHHKNNSITHSNAVPDPQISIYAAHKDKNNYAIALYTDHAGKALITYDSPTCQANSYGDTSINSKNKTEIEFTATEDPACKIILEKTNNNQLKITKETPACNAWHGDFCSFSSLSPLTRIYPSQQTKVQ